MFWNSIEFFSCRIFCHFNLLSVVFNNPNQSKLSNSWLQIFLAEQIPDRRLVNGSLDFYKIYLPLQPIKFFIQKENDLSYQ